MSVKPKMPNQWLNRTGWNWLFPVNCVGCQAEGAWVCPDCQGQLVPSRIDICVLCAKAGEGGLCDTCQKRTGLDAVASPFKYNNRIVRELIKAGKFEGYHSALVFIGHITAWPDWLREPGIVFAPIPLSARRLAERGYNQATIIARTLAPRPARLFTGLIRSKETAPQSLLSKKDRARNVQDSFVCTQPAPKKVVLVDDVVTTGATLAAAAAALKKAGAKNVWAVTIAHG